MKNRIAILLVVSVVLALTLSACAALKGVTDVGDSFMTALRDGDAVSSWDMLAENVKSEVGDQTAWGEFVAPRNFSKWSFSNTQINNDVAQLDGEATLGAEVYDMTLVLDQYNDTWLVSGISFSLQE